MKHFIFNLAAWFIGSALLPLTGLAQGTQKPSFAAPGGSQPWKGTANDPAMYLKQAGPMSERRSTAPVAQRLLPLPKTSPANKTTAACANLLPNPSFEDQLVSPLSGSRFNIGNIGGTGAYGDELANWRSTNGSSPDYFATNAPTTGPYGSGSNPNTTDIGTFTPHFPNPALHNGTVGFYIAHYALGDDDQEYINPGAIPLTGGAYYAEFFAARSSYSQPGGNAAFRLGMNFTTSDPRTTSKNQVFQRPTDLNYSFQSQNFLTSSDWQRVSGVVTVAPGSYFVNIGNIEPTVQAGLGFAYYLIDDVALYKIPTAGSNQTVEGCTTSPATVALGEGCEILGAQYQWSVNNQVLTPNTLHITVTVGTTTTYQLRVTLPDGTYSYSTATITVSTPSPPDAPSLTLLYDDHDCKGQVVYTIDNYDYYTTYTCNRVYHINGGFFDTPGQVRIKSNDLYGTFTITATRCGVSTTSELYEAYFCTDPIAEARTAATAYPNPASESLTVPTGATDAVLLNSQGKAVARPDKGGRFDIQRLPAGLYNLQMQQNGKRVNQRIEVKH